MEKIKIKVNESIYLKSPDESKLGRGIINHSITLIDELGFEDFNFKKLALEIGSTEASIYRYFENKHKLLLYLIAWYWNWIEYHFVFRSEFLDSDKEKIKLALNLISKPITLDPTFEELNENALYRIIVSESQKVFLTKEVDKEEDEGCFQAYEQFCHRVALLIVKENVDYKYPHSLVSALIETAHNQRFFSKHMKPVTEFGAKNDKDLLEFLNDIMFKVIEK